MSLINDLSENRVLIIVGPTAVGKTEVALWLAESISTEIVSADSRQVYRYLDIGTAKPTLEERGRVPHHFIDIRDPDHYYSAGEYGREARQCIAELRQRGTAPIVVGGSGFYIRALVDGLFAPRISNPAVKGKWRMRIQNEGNEAVFSYLQQIDPRTAEHLHPNDTQRIVRALEVYELSGQVISQFRQGNEEPASFRPVFVGLRRNRKMLYERIERRVEQMLDSGLVDEVKALQKKGWGSELNALRTVGYQEMFAFLDGQYSYEEMVQKIKTSSRQYAKRQMTWFGKDKRIHWLEMDDRAIGDVVEEIRSLLG